MLTQRNPIFLCLSILILDKGNMNRSENFLLYIIQYNTKIIYMTEQDKR